MNAQGATVVERLEAVPGQIDQVALHGVRLGTALGLAGMSTWTGSDYAQMPTGFRDGLPHEVEGIEGLLGAYDNHADAAANSTNPESVLNKLFTNEEE